VNAERGTRNSEGEVEKGTDLKERTKNFSLRVIHFIQSLPRGLVIDVIGRQLLRSATSVAANYRAVRRARSRREFLSKLGIAEEEADETAFWLELLVESKLVRAEAASELRDEANQLVAITVSSIRTARSGARLTVPRSAFRVPTS